MKERIYYLWKYAPTDAHFSFLPQDELPHAGFSSVYGVSQADAEAMLAAGSFAGFRGVVYGDMGLFIDADTDQAADAARAALRAAGVGYNEWHTGNRGRHFVVERLAAPSQFLPTTDKEWVRTICPSADLKLYTHLHLIRRPGAIHAKTGQAKRLVDSHGGRTLHLEPKEPERKRAELVTGFRSVFTDARVQNLTVPYFDGERTDGLLQLALAVARCGQDPAFVLGYVRNVNAMGDPLDDERIERMVEWAIREAGR